MNEQAPAVARPPVELRAFDKVALAAGEEKTVHFTLNRRAFAYFDAPTNTWAVQPGAFEIRVGGSSRDLPLTLALDVGTTQKAIKPMTRYSVSREFKEVPGGQAIYDELIAALGFGTPTAPDPKATPEQLAAQRKALMSTLSFIDEMPLAKIPAFSHGRFSDARVEEILRKVNASLGA